MGQPFLNDDSGSRPTALGFMRLAEPTGSARPAPWTTKVLDNRAQRKCPMAHALARCIL